MDKASILFGICIVISQISNAQQKTLSVFNPLNEPRTDELVIIRRDEFKAAFKTLTNSQYLSLKDTAGLEKPIQFDDLDGDGIWDEAVFLQSFRSLENVDFHVSLTRTAQTGGTSRAHVRHRRLTVNNSFGPDLGQDSIPEGQENTDFSKVSLPQFLTEGPGWENDKLGFRLYFDKRNGKDIWGKTTAEMVLDMVGTIAAESYHKKSWWGMDIYKVGSSLSAGALAIYFRTSAGTDTLVRLGGKNMGRVIYEKNSDGPIRASFRLTYPAWKVAEGLAPVNLYEEISIWGGQYFYESSVHMKNAPEGAELVTGFANLSNLPAGYLKTKSHSALYSYGIQSENKDHLGLAVVANNSEIVKFSDTKSINSDIKDSYLLSLKIPENSKPLTFKFYAAWEQTDPQFSEKEKFEGFLLQQLRRLDKALSIKWK